MSSYGPHSLAVIAVHHRDQVLGVLEVVTMQQWEGLAGEAGVLELVGLHMET